MNKEINPITLLALTRFTWEVFRAGNPSALNPLPLQASPVSKGAPGSDGERWDRPINSRQEINKRRK